MAVDKTKVTAEATKLVQKGQFDKAIKAYEKILAEDAKDVRVLLKVGELQQKKGDNAAAAETFSRVADAYGEQGFFLKAVAVYKQMMKLAPDDVRVNERLAALYQQLGILSDAMGQLQLVAAAAEKAGDQRKLLDVLRRMVELEPENVASAVKLGELYAKQSQPKLALEHLRRAAEQLRRLNRADEYVKVAERIAFLAPDDVALTRELAHLHLARGDTKRALAKLQLCFKADPKDLETLTLLAQAFQELGQLQKTVSVYKELAHLQAEKGRADEARATWRKVLDVAPADAEALQACGGARPTPSPGPAVPRSAPAPGSPARPATAAAATAAAGASALGPQAIPKLLTETDVYVKYGLHDKALDHLQKVFAIDPEHLDAREKALKLRVARGDAAGAAEEAARVARLAMGRGLRDRALAALTQLRELAPGHPTLALEEQLAAPTPVAEEELVLDDGEDLVLEVEPPGAEEGADALALHAAVAPGDDLVDDDEPISIDDEAVMLEDDPAPIAAPPVVAVPVQVPVPPVAAPRVAAPLPPIPRAAPPPAPIRPAAARAVSAQRPPPPALVVAPPPPPPPPPPAARADPEELEEVEFFVQQGLLGEAREALQALEAAHPGDARVAACRAALERAAETAAPAPAAPAPSAAAAIADESFDIARELAEELGAAPATPAADEEFQYTVEDIFDQFKKGIAQTVKPEDADTHYDLGIAYKEMGLLDDALHEFEVALAGKGRKKEVDCLSMIAVCLMEKGDAAGAVQAYQRALHADHLTTDAARALHYEIAGAYEASGDRASAQQFLQKVLKIDPSYRDAQAMSARLGAAVAPAAGSAPGPKKNIGYV